MITFFRKISETWFVKLFLAMITISMMGLFGLGSMTGEWGKNKDAIRVGSKVIYGPHLVADVEREVNRMSLMNAGRPLSLSDAVKLGVVDAVVRQNAAELLYEVAMDDLDLVASDEAIKNYVVNNPLFQTMTGSFDRSTLIAYLDKMRMSEQEFKTALRAELARKHLADAVHAVVKVPGLMGDKIYDYTYETRDLDTISIPVSSVKVTGKPDVATLQDYYESMQSDLYTPEYRFVKVLKMTPEKVASDIAVDEATLKELYEEKKHLYSTPEKRQLEQIQTKTAEEAEALFAKLTSENFAQVAKENGQENISLGWVEKNAVAEQIGEAAFEAPLNTVLAPVETPFGYHILIVRAIEKATQTPYEDVKTELANAVKAEGAYDILYEKSKLLEDALGEGLSLDEAAKRVAVNTEDVVKIDISGQRFDGEQSALPNELVQELFLSKVGETTSIQDYQNGFIVGVVEKIEEISLKPFEMVQSELIAEWTKDQQKNNAPEFANGVLAAVQNGKLFKTAALFYGLEEKPLTSVRRMDLSDLPAQKVSTLFNAKEKDIELVEFENGDYVVVQIQKISPADKDDVVARLTLDMDLKNKMVATVIDEVLAYYGTKETLEINQNLINEIFGQYVSQPEEE